MVIAYGCSWSNKDRPLVNPASRAPRNEDTRLMPTAGSLNAAYFQQSCCEHHQNTPTNYLKNLWIALPFSIKLENLQLHSARIGKNKNTRTVQAESSKFASVLFDQGFQIWVGWN